MKFKKITTVIISITLIISLMTPVYGTVTVTETVTTKNVDSTVTTAADKEKMDAAKISKDKAIEIAKEALKDYFDYVFDEKDFESRIEFREDYRGFGDYTWQIEWYKYNHETSTNISVSINSNTGKVTSIRKRIYDHSENRPTIAQITENEAQAIGDAFIQKVFPEEYKEVKLIDNLYPRSYYDTSYRFTYSRYINDVKYDANSIMVEVDGIDGAVTSIDCYWDNEINVPTTENVIDASTARQVMEDNMEMVLNYIAYRNDYSDKINEIKLVYSPSFQNGYMVDAKQGIMIDTANRVVEEEALKDISDEKKKEIFTQADTIKEQETEISEERANEIITALVKDLYGEDYTIESLRYTENDDYWATNGKKCWSARFSKGDYFSSMDEGEITINALTEQLMSSYLYSHYERMMQEENYEPAITWEEGYDKAIEAIATYFPDKIMDIDTELKYVKYEHYYNGKLMPEFEYNYSFQRKVNDIYFREDSIHISIDSKDGSIKEVRTRWNDDVDFPSTTDIISEEDAIAIYFEKYTPELVYSRINKSNDYKNPEWEIQLVYRLTSSFYTGQYIDSYTGKFLSYTGEEVTEANKEFKELIKDHEAEKELSILASQGILDVEDFEFDKEVTRMDAIKMLVTAKGYRPYMASQADSLKFTNVTMDNDNYSYLQMAIVYGIIENKEEVFQFDDKITREELAEMIVRLLGYNDIADIEGIFKAPCKDSYSISNERVGYVAICIALDIMKTNGFNVFKPQSNVTMVDMSVAIYNALGKLRRN